MKTSLRLCVVAIGLACLLTGGIVLAQVFVANGGAGDLLVGTSPSAFGRILPVAAGSYLRSNGTTVAPLWSTATLPNTTTTGDLLTSTGTNVVGVTAAVASGQVLTSAGTGTVPAWSASPTITTLTIGSNVTLASTTPTITSGFGTTPSITGNATAFRLTLGTPVGQTGVVAFATTFTNAPSVQCGDETSIAGDPIKAAPTTTNVTLTFSTAVAADKVSCVVVGF